MGVRKHLGIFYKQKKETEKVSGSRVPVTMRDFFFDDPFFKNSWEDFDKVRDAMFQESRDMWKKFDDDFRNMACMSNNIMLEHSGAGNQKQQESIASSNNNDNNSNRSLMRQDSKSRWEWVDVSKTMDVASSEHRLACKHGHLQGQGQR